MERTYQWIEKRGSYHLYSQGVNALGWVFPHVRVGFVWYDAETKTWRFTAGLLVTSIGHDTVKVIEEKMRELTT